jgi:hypothetical protein
MRLRSGISSHLWCKRCSSTTRHSACHSIPQQATAKRTPLCSRTPTNNTRTPGGMSRAWPLYVVVLVSGTIQATTPSNHAKEDHSEQSTDTVTQKHAHLVMTAPCLLTSTSFCFAKNLSTTANGPSLAAAAAGGPAAAAGGALPLLGPPTSDPRLSLSLSLSLLRSRSCCSRSRPPCSRSSSRSRSRSRPPLAPSGVLSRPELGYLSLWGPSLGRCCVCGGSLLL